MYPMCNILFYYNKNKHCFKILIISNTKIPIYPIYFTCSKYPMGKWVNINTKTIIILKVS